MTIDFEFDLEQEVWFIGSYGVADKSKIIGRRFEEAVGGYETTYHLENNADKTEEQLFESPEALARAVFSVFDFMVTIAPKPSEKMLPKQATLQEFCEWFIADNELNCPSAVNKLQANVARGAIAKICRIVGYYKEPVEPVNPMVEKFGAAVDVRYGGPLKKEE